jgi:hypothetical protein
MHQRARSRDRTLVLIWLISLCLVETSGLEPPTPCLQSTPGTSR